MSPQQRPGGESKRDFYRARDSRPHADVVVNSVRREHAVKSNERAALPSAAAASRVDLMSPRPIMLVKRWIDPWALK